MIPFGTLWRIARRDLAARFRGLQLLALCLFLGVATLAAIGSLTRGITAELEARGQTILGGDVEFALPQREAMPDELAAFRRTGATSATVRMRAMATAPGGDRSEEHTSELQSLMRRSYAVFCWKKKTTQRKTASIRCSRV